MVMLASTHTYPALAPAVTPKPLASIACACGVGHPCAPFAPRGVRVDENP